MSRERPSATLLNDEPVIVNWIDVGFRDRDAVDQTRIVLLDRAE